MKQLSNLSAFVLVAFLLFSCNNKQHEAKDSSINNLIESVDAEPPTPQKNQKQVPIGNGTQVNTDSTATPVRTAGTPAPAIDWDKQIIKTATLRLEVKHFDKFNQSVHQRVKQFGGYVAAEEQNITDQSLATTISIKVPVAQFDALLNQLPDDGDKLLERRVNTEDVTTEVVDTKSRLEAKKQMRLKYLDFLKQSKNMEEVLQVQGEINRIQEEIEAATGRMQYLTHSAAMSTINLSFYQPLAGFEPTDTNPSFMSRFINALKAGGTSFINLFILLVHLWPLLLLGIAILLFRRRKILSKPAA